MESVHDPFHEGERRVQALAGQTAVAESNGAMISGRIMSSVLPFLAQQTFVLIALEAAGQMWCAMVSGPAGLLSSADGRTLRIHLHHGLADEQVLAATEEQQRVGILVMDLATRRRIRINGRLSRSAPGELQLSVAEAYPNCPKFITRRIIHPVSVPKDNAAVRTGTLLEPAHMHAIASADLLFLASEHPERGADASHRGGLPGFVSVPDAHTVSLPDYPGNGMFNTLGNLEVDSRIGIAIPDFQRSILLQLSGHAQTRWEGERRLEIEVETWREQPLAIESGELLDYSPFNPPVVTD